MEKKTEPGLSDYDQLMGWVNKRTRLLSLRDEGGYDLRNRRYIFSSAEREELKALTKKINDFHKSTNFLYA